MKPLNLVKEALFPNFGKKVSILASSTQ